MEQLGFSFDGLASSDRGIYAIAGVVASGDLEILIERKALDGRCEVAINTSIHGFETTWRAVMQRFVTNRPLADTRVTVNDSGATPAIVSLRLAQAAQSLDEESR
ncbi:malonate decarboxylase subunit delta [Caballeronia pedi]|uniref:Malonate decarboxylase acyl carrier protein n=1 Tax=Caballeronia pedi TaxID=1777141 RepID=A0A157ZMF3_9BURK|nr:malonate decarboxylase acyl carrier protein [Caballeronia pedi]SAK46702.1 malonate decarboxylase subunit delta [Caballeronia pedi]